MGPLMIWTHSTNVSPNQGEWGQCPDIRGSKYTFGIVVTWASGLLGVGEAKHPGPFEMGQIVKYRGDREAEVVYVDRSVHPAACGIKLSDGTEKNTEEHFLEGVTEEPKDAALGGGDPDEEEDPYLTAVLEGLIPDDLDDDAAGGDGGADGGGGRRSRRRRKSRRRRRRSRRRRRRRRRRRKSRRWRESRRRRKRRSRRGRRSRRRRRRRRRRESRRQRGSRRRRQLRRGRGLRPGGVHAHRSGDRAQATTRGGREKGRETEGEGKGHRAQAQDRGGEAEGKEKKRKGGEGGHRAQAAERGGEAEGREKEGKREAAEGPAGRPEEEAARHGDGIGRRWAARTTEWPTRSQSGRSREPGTGLLELRGGGSP